MEMSYAIALVRRDIGDPAETFLVNAISDGMTMVYDMPQQMVNPVGLNLQFIDNAVTVPILPLIVPGTQTIENPAGHTAFPAWNSQTAYQPGSQVLSLGLYYISQEANTGILPSSNSSIWAPAPYVYTLDVINGVLIFNQTLPLNATLVGNGTSWSMFTDSELASVILDAERQHCQGQTLTERYRNSEGFITYRDTPKTLKNIPKIEENLLITLADIDAMWILATDAATDVNVDTAEGTNIDRTARYNQLMGHIEALREKYQLWCGQLGVGMFRIETLNMRRVSRTNNRLVPLYREREYDDHRYPVRELPQIDRRDEDSSGVPSPIWNGLPL